ncbi:MAG: tetratricopeptide repeat protein [Armatimonadota bacterium]|nr:tetratricopeptide repeat protein [Armatimonadota bacterium]
MPVTKARGNRRLLPIGIAGLVLLLLAGGIRVYTDMARQRARAAAENAQATAQKAEVAQAVATLKRLQRAVTAHPKDVAARWALADQCQKWGFIQLAADQLDAIALLQPRNEQVRLSQANAKLALKQFSEAEADYRALLNISPDSADGWQGLAALLYHERRYLEATTAAKKAAEFRPNDVSNRFILAAASLHDAEEYPDPERHVDALGLARAELQKVTRVWSNNPGVYLMLGRDLDLLHDRQGAIEQYRRAAAIIPSTEVALLLANDEIAIGDYASARALADTTLKQDPKSGALYELKARSFENSKDPEAIRLSTQAVEMAASFQPRNPHIWETAGATHLRSGNIQQALKDFQTAAGLEPDKPLPYQQLAAIYRRLGDSGQATTMERRASAMAANEQQLNKMESQVQGNPQSIALHMALAGRCRALGWIGAARDEYLTALNLDSNNKDAENGLASIPVFQSDAGSAEQQPAVSAGGVPGATPVP